MRASSRRSGVLRSAGWALVGKLTSAAGGIGVSILVTRILEPNQVGVYFILASVAAVGALLSRFGLEKGILQLVGRSPESIGRSVPRAMVLRTIEIVTLVWVVVAGFILVLGPAAIGLMTPAPLEATTFLLLVAWVGVLAYEQLFAESFRAADFIPEASVFGGALGRSLAVLALAALLLSPREGTITLVLVLIVASLSVSVLASAATLVRRSETTDAPSVPWGHTMRLGMPLLVSNIVLYVAGTADLWILGVYRTDSEVALYGAAVRLVTMVALFLSVANAILPPMVARLRATPVRLERRVRLISTCAAVPAVLVLVVLGGWSATVLDVLFGDFYRGGAVALVVLCLGQLANIAVGSCGYVLVVSGHQRDLMWTALGAGSIAILGAFLLAPGFGIVGVAGAVALGTVIHQLSMLFLAHMRTGVWTHVGLRYLRLAARCVRRGGLVT